MNALTKFVGIALSTALFASAAHATTVSFTFNGNTPGHTIERTVDGGANWYTTSVGYFSNTRTGGDFGGHLIGPGINLAQFTAFCIEPREVISTGSSYTYDVSPLANAPTNVVGGMGATRAQQLNDLLGTYYPDFSASISNQQAAALQIAIWEIVRETNTGPLDVLTGQVQFRNPQDASEVSLAQTYLNAISAPGSHPQPLHSLTALIKVGAQDMIVQFVPEPASLALFVMGGLAWFTGNRRRLNTWRAS